MKLGQFVFVSLGVLNCAGCVVPPPRPVAYYPQVTPVQTVQNCREFDSQIMVDGKPEQAHGTACQQPDGSWRVADTPQPTAQVATQSAQVPYYSYAPYPYYSGYYYGPPIALGVGLRFGHRW